MTNSLDLPTARTAAQVAVARAERAKMEGVPRFIQYMLNEDARVALGDYRMAIDLSKGA